MHICLHADGIYIVEFDKAQNSKVQELVLSGTCGDDDDDVIK